MATAVVAESRYDPRCDTVEALDARLVECVRSRAPLRRALARIAGAFVARRAWEPLGFVRPADYVRERPGLSARELHELARVDGALGRLPAIDAALGSGRLGWTKARLLCRVATPEDEGRWLEAAARLSAAALAREVRAIDVGALEARGAETSDDTRAEREVLRIRAATRVRTKWGDVKRTLRRVTGEWLPTDACVELALAEVLSAIGLESGPEEPHSLAREVRAGGAGPVPAPALPPPGPATPSPFVLALVDGLDGASPRELDGRLCRAAALERGLLARIGPLLLAFAELRGPGALGFRSLDAYARERLGISPRKARALLRLERAGQWAPTLGEAWHAGVLTVCQAQALVPLLLTAGSEAFHAAWITRAGEVTVRRLEDDVEHALATGAFDLALLPDLTDFTLGPAGVQTGARPTHAETDVWSANVPADLARLFRACLSSVARRLGTGPGGALEAMFDHVIASWWVSTPRKYRVFERDGWRCTVPGCTSQRNLHGHHVLFRSAGGGDDLANLTTLCAAHHQRCVPRHPSLAQRAQPGTSEVGQAHRPLLDPLCVDRHQRRPVVSVREHRPHRAGPALRHGIVREPDHLGRLVCQHIGWAGAAEQEQGAIARGERGRAERGALHLEGLGGLPGEQVQARHGDSAGVDPLDLHDGHPIGSREPLVEGARPRNPGMPDRRHGGLRQSRACEQQEEHG
jgi:hypothetical protein